MRIAVLDYRKKMGTNSTQHEYIKEKLSQIINRTLSPNELNINVYYLAGAKADYYAGIKDRRLNIYLGASFKSKEVFAVEDMVINDIQTNFNITMEPMGGDNIVQIKSKEGRVLAEYDKEKEEMVILVDMFAELNEHYKSIFEYIMSEFNRLVILEKQKRNSWIHGEKEYLKGILKNTFSRNLKERLEANRRQLHDYEELVRDYQRKLKQSYDRIRDLMKQIELGKNGISEAEIKVLADLDLISNHEKIKDVHILQNGKIQIHTEPLIMTADTGKQYYLGNATITIDIHETDIRFNSNNKRRSYWTDKDPHPHVNGDNGAPCWGNVSSTIAELCSQNELYALVMICIDYLESANTQDPAGQNVVNWERWDGEKIIGVEDVSYCDLCEEMCDDDELTTVYNYADIDTVNEPARVCESCLESSYFFSEYHEEYISDEYQDVDFNELAEEADEE